MTAPEVAFTGDTTSDFIVDEANADVLSAKILVMEVYILIVITFQLEHTGYSFISHLRRMVY